MASSVSVSSDSRPCRHSVPIRLEARSTASASSPKKASSIRSMRLSERFSSMTDASDAVAAGTETMTLPERLSRSTVSSCARKPSISLMKLHERLSVRSSFTSGRQPSNERSTFPLRSRTRSVVQARSAAASAMRLPLRLSDRTGRPHNTAGTVSKSLRRRSTLPSVVIAESDAGSSERWLCPRLSAMTSHSIPSDSGTLLSPRLLRSRRLISPGSVTPAVMAFWAISQFLRSSHACEPMLNLLPPIGAPAPDAVRSGVRSPRNHRSRTGSCHTV